MRGHWELLTTVVRSRRVRRSVREQLQVCTSALLYPLINFVECCQELPLVFVKACCLVVFVLVFQCIVPHLKAERPAKTRQLLEGGG